MKVELIYAIFAAVAVAIPHGGSQKVSSLGEVRRITG